MKKKRLWYILKCQNCGKVFQEKDLNEFDTLFELKQYAEHIGAKTHIVATHKCKPNIYGCAKLIGVQIRN